MNMRIVNMFMLVSVFLLSSCISCNKNGAVKTEPQFVHASGIKIVEGNGSEIILKGLGLGGWMVQEGYILGTSGAQHKIREYLESMAGVSATDKFYEDWLTYFVNENDVKQIADWGYNSIRLPMHYNLYFDESGNWLENSKGLELTDNLLSWCKANNLYLILDLHAAPGGQGNNQDISDRRDGEFLWTSAKAQEMTKTMWYKLAEKYANETQIAGYDLLNEPNYDFENTGNDKGCTCLENKPLLELYKSLIDTIRRVDKNHLLIIEGNCYGSNYKGLESLGSYDSEKNLALSFHNYWSPNIQESTQSMLDLRSQLKVPLWRGEIGENSNTWFTEMVESMESLQIGWANWPWKKINNLDGPVIITPIEEWNMLIAYKSDNSKPRPTQQQAQLALTKMIENIKLENCRLMHDVSYAYLNSPFGEGTKAYNNLSIPGTVFATDYDYGKLNESWYDMDYQNISGSSSNTAWNKGLFYRNDGVDIWQTSDEFSNGYYVGSIENNEWLSYTLSSVKSANYEIVCRVKSSSLVAGEITLSLDGNEVLRTSLNVLKTNTWQDLSFKNIQLNGGSKLKIKFNKGGFDFSKITFIEEK